MASNTFNGRNQNKTPVIEKQFISDSKTLETVTAEAPVITPEIEKEVPPKRKRPTGLILPALGVGALA
ncbi:hypothetical protein [Nostoc flagelliforme]|uniref:hypothetical protein n=1 Tax=Nostoc flagelliforme TaxID=1306274 RepID=UPI0018F04555|nr:hypothetical protein [Nostoc flagelliforme]